ncbi:MULTISPECIES: SDR family oxidoreductase [unclassified Janthinobacterium]|uniref:UDP-glucose 4-epimerase family protein n=1 Tax=unclassified Janthinobacterium TaxID=2610881 RepID=UPI0018CB6D27|nr:SDR family oxidoreductase [Janthinobacterium sp. CG_23.4]MDH6159371.1 nucleoside-diphosphate-sugar epimerase [Janthinobacterium sp. CG_23.4]
MILLTGGTGFVGSAVLARLVADGAMPVRAAVRSAGAHIAPGIDTVAVGSLAEETDWREALAGVSALVHCAARVHVMDESAADPLVEFRRVNVQGTLALARQAAAAGVKRFVFISSIKVNGEMTAVGKPFTAEDIPAPADAYGVSKMEAEQALRALESDSGMQVVIIRPPLVYGKGVKANFAAMMRWLARGIPLPLGAIHNRRSLVALDNLVDLIVTCVDHPQAAGQTFLVSDGQDPSTTELLQRMGRAMGRPARLIPVPSACLTFGASLLGKGAVAQRLCGSLQVDIDKTRRMLDWTPPLTLDQGLQEAAKGTVRETRV